MDIERVNSVLVRAIAGLQDGELGALVERWVHGVSSYEIPAPGQLVPHGRLPEGSRDVSKRVLDDAMHRWREYGRLDLRFGGKIKTKGGGKRTKSETAVLKVVGKGIALPFISSVLLFDDKFRRLKKNEKKALLSLVARGVLKVYLVPEPLPEPDRPSDSWGRYAASASNHYRVMPA